MYVLYKLTGWQADKPPNNCHGKLLLSIVEWERSSLLFILHWPDHQVLLFFLGCPIRAWPLLNFSFYFVSFSVLFFQSHQQQQQKASLTHSHTYSTHTSETRTERGRKEGGRETGRINTPQENFLSIFPLSWISFLNWLYLCRFSSYQTLVLFFFFFFFLFHFTPTFYLFIMILIQLYYLTTFYFISLSIFLSFFLLKVLPCAAVCLTISVLRLHGGRQGSWAELNWAELENFGQGLIWFATAVTTTTAAAAATAAEIHLSDWLVIIGLLAILAIELNHLCLWLLVALALFFFYPFRWTCFNWSCGFFFFFSYLCCLFSLMWYSVSEFVRVCLITLILILWKRERKKSNLS